MFDSIKDILKTSLMMDLAVNEAFYRGGIFGFSNEFVNSEFVKIALHEPTLKSIKEAYETEKYETAIKLADSVLNPSGEFEFGEETAKVALWYKANSLFGFALQLCNKDYSLRDDINEKAKNIIIESFYQFTIYGNEYGWNDDILYQQMLIGSLVKNFFWGRSRAIILLESNNPNYRSAAFDIYNEATDDLFHMIEQYADDGKFTKWQLYEKRKYIFIGRDIQHIAGTYQLVDKERMVNWIFTIDQLPPDIEFPLGRPQPGLYMAHPVKTEQYFPMKNAEETLFMEKVREFCWLAQCLGAREVSFHSIKGMSVSEGYGTSMNIEANVGVKGVNVGGSYGNSSRHDGTRSSHQQVERVQHFDPKKKAYCPDDLVWLDSDPAWKDLIKQRLNGNMLDYTYKISSSETCQMSSNEKNEVKANFEFMMVKVNGSYNSEKDTTFSSSKETEWSIHVEFAPLSELTGDSSFSNTNIRLSKNDQEYLNEVKETIEDYDEIGPKERKRLEKTRMRLGISESRAAEIEASICQPKLTDEEKEYLDEIREVRKDYDGISQKERKYLEKTRIRLGISIERANELERM